MVDPSAKGSRFDTGKTGVNGQGRTQAGERTLTRTLGFRPACDCGRDDYEPGLVLDPFAGAGTVGVVCTELGRRFVGVDASATYCDMARERIGEHEVEALPLFEGVR